MEVKHFRLFFVFMVAGLGDLIWESSNFSNTPNTKERSKFILRWLRDLGNTFLEQNLRLKTLGYLFFIHAILLTCCLDAPWLTFDCYWRNSVIHLILITLHLGYQFLIQRLFAGVGSLHLIEFWVGIDHKGITHLVTHPNCRKYSPQTCTQIFQNVEMPPIPPNSYSLTLWWHLGLHNTSLNARFSMQNFSVCWSIKSTS